MMADGTGSRLSALGVRRLGLAPLGGVMLLASVALGVAGCGSAPVATPSTLVAGQVPKSEVPHFGAHGQVEVANTVPLAAQNPITALFTALGTFQSCLAGQGEAFHGVPHPFDPSSPYGKALITCASKSNILNALKAAQASQNNLTLSQIQKENKQYLQWRKCMIGRGWGIPVPTPNSKGLLFSFGGAGGGTPNFKPPPGQSLLNSPDMQACASKVGTTSGGV